MLGLDVQEPPPEFVTATGQRACRAVAPPKEGVVATDSELLALSGQCATVSSEIVMYKFAPKRRAPSFSGATRVKGTRSERQAKKLHSQSIDRATYSRQATHTADSRYTAPTETLLLSAAFVSAALAACGHLQPALTCSLRSLPPAVSCGLRSPARSQGSSTAPSSRSTRSTAPLRATSMAQPCGWRSMQRGAVVACTVAVIRCSLQLYMWS